MKNNLEQPTKKKWTTSLRLSKNEISGATKKSMGTRIVTAIVLLILIVPAIFIGGWFFHGLMFIVSVIAVYEILHAMKISKRNWFLYLLAMIITLALTFWIFFKYNMIENSLTGYNLFDITKWEVWRGFGTIEVSTVLLAVLLIGLFMLLVADKNFNFDISAYLFLLILFMGIGFQAFTFLRFFPLYLKNTPGSGFNPTNFTSAFLVLYAILGTIGNDVGAYFVGVLYGKNKMNPRLSPNKTWEGFAGGVVMSLVISFGFAMIVSLFGHPIIPVLSHHNWHWLLLFSALMPIFANIGDLFFSSSKRHFMIKDYGTFLRGHGGILDRIDSLIMVSLVMGVLVILLNNGWNLLA